MMLSQRMAARCLARWLITLDRGWLVEAIEWHRLRLEIDATNARAAVADVSTIDEACKRDGEE